MGTQAALLGPCRKIHVQSHVPLSYLPLVGHPQQLLGASLRRASNLPSSLQLFSRQPAYPPNSLRHHGRGPAPPP